MSTRGTPGRGPEASPEAKREIIDLLAQARDRARDRAARRGVLGREALPLLEDYLAKAGDGTLFGRATSVNLGLYRGTYDIDPVPADDALVEALRAVDHAWERLIFDPALVDGELWL